MARKRKQHSTSGSLINRYARSQYEILDTIEAGMVLSGGEVKSLRLGKGNLRDSFVTIRNGEGTIHNFHIPGYAFADLRDYNPTRTRKLLLHRKEIEQLESKTQAKGRVLVPLKVYLSHNRYKVEVAVARGKKEYEKREDLKRRDLDRELRRQFKESQLK